MKLSLNWLKQFVKLPSELSAKQIMYDLTMSTVEVEHVHDLAASLNKICVGQIKQIAKHPDADKLKITQTDLGPLGVKQIVCGGSNLSENMFVVVSLPGALVNWHGQTELQEVKETKIRGQASYGMICASEEIGLSNLFPATQAAEIIDLSGFEVEAGQPLAEAIGFNDFILEIDNKSLSNRPDLWGHLGIARELSAIYDSELKLPTLANLNFIESKDLTVKILEPELCSRYIGLVLENITNSDSPFWLKSQLARVGQRPISLLVDLTNYVMLALGQPTHVFDYTKVQNACINVRLAKDGEQIKLLDDSLLKLNNSSLVIADQQNPLALAGIMGGAASGVTNQTTKIIFEAANFYSIKIRKTVSQYNIRTESSVRFEKALDPINAELAARLFIQTLQTIQPDLKLVSAVDEFLKKPETLIIDIDHEFIASRLGSTVESKFIEKKLQNLGFKVAANNSGYNVTVPTHRATGDVSIKQDIIEEIARMIGYDNLVYQPINTNLTNAVRQNEFINERKIRDLLVNQAGLIEVLNYPWVNRHSAKICGHGSQDLIQLAESPGTDCETIRISLIPGILESLSKNYLLNEHFGIFEIGSVFETKLQPFSNNSTHEKLPAQHKKLGLAIIGKDQQEVFLQLKLAIENIFSRLNFPHEFRPVNDLTFKNRGALGIYSATTQLGFIAIPSGKILQHFGIKHGCVALAELNFTALRSLNSAPKIFVPVPKYPAVDFDLALIFDQSASWENIQKSVLDSNKTIQSVKFMDLYQGEQVPSGKKSIAFGMHIVPTEKTLTADEIASISEQVLKKLKQEFNAELRS